MTQKNINIVYNVDTQSIQVAKAQVDQAKQATDALTQSAKNLGDQGSANTQKFSNNIDGLRVQMQQLKAQIELTSQSDTATLNARIALYKEMQKELDKYTQGLKETQTQTQNVGTSLNGLYNTVRAVITAGLIKETISATLEMAKLAGQVEGVKRAFDRLPNSVFLMEELREKTHGTIDELELMQTALKAQNFKIPLEQLGTLLEFASIRAQQTGQSVEYLVNSIVLGLGYNSIRRLDNVGLSVDSLKQKMKETGMTLREAFGSFINEELQKMGGYLETSATKVDQLSASWKNLKQEIAAAANDAGFLGGLIGVLDSVVRGVRNIFVTDTQTGLRAAKDYAAGIIETHKNNKQAIENEIKLIDQRGAKESLEILILKDRQAELAKLAIRSPKQQQELEDSKNQIKNLETFNSLNRETVKILSDYLIGLNKKNTEDKKQIGLIEAIDEKIKDLNEELVKTTSQKRIIQIQVEIKQLESQRLDLLDPDRAAKKAKQTYDQINKEIGQGVREGAEKIPQEVNKSVDSFNKELVKNSNKEYKQFIAGLKLAMAEAKKLRNQEQADWDQFVKKGSRLIGQELVRLTNTLINSELQEYDERIQNLHDYYAQQEDLAGNNTKRKEQLQKQEAKQLKVLEKEKKEAEKKAASIRIGIDTISAIMRNFASAPLPYGAILAGIAAAFGAAQLAAVNKFAEGVIDLKGPGTTTSDSIPSMLSRGESVMTAEETRGSMNILKGIRAKKLNDQILDRLTITTEGIVANLDDRRIVSAIERNKTPDLVRQFGTIYEAKEIGKNTKRIIRSKSFTN